MLRSLSLLLFAVVAVATIAGYILSRRSDDWTDLGDVP